MTVYPPSLLMRMAQIYGYDQATFSPPTSGYRNSVHHFTTDLGNDLNLIIYKRESGIEARIARTNQIGAWLADRSLPVRAPVDNRILRIGAGDSVRYASLYNFLPGDTIPWEAYTKHHIKLLGMVLGDLHDQLRDFSPKEHFPSVVDEYHEQLNKMRRYFDDPSVRSALSAKCGVEISTSRLERLGDILNDCAKIGSQQLLHMDLVRGNVLFSTPDEKARFSTASVSVSGILDFEKASIGHPLFDVARTLAFLMVDCSGKPASKIRKYLIDSGYNKRSQIQLKPIALPSGDMLESLIDLFLMYDFYKFLRQNPYESLGQNYHFVRTRDILVQRKMLQ